MNEDYLWDKTGEDPEIERLENMLTAFRYQETAAPAFQTAKAAPVVEKAPRWNFSFAFAFATCVVLAIIAGVWFQFSNRTVGSGNDVAVIEPQQTSVEKPSNNTYSNIEGKNAETTDNTQLTPSATPVAIKHLTRRSTRRNTFTARNFTAKKQPVVLTDEEKYAYGQLMLALSITGSKLRLVNDAITRIEDRTLPELKNER